MVGDRRRMRPVAILGFEDFKLRLSIVARFGFRKSSDALKHKVASLLLWIAEMDREHLRERQAAGIAQATARVVRFGRRQWSG